jgi:hypothetical protein
MPRVPCPFFEFFEFFEFFGSSAVKLTDDERYHKRILMRLPEWTCGSTAAQRISRSAAAPAAALARSEAMCPTAQSVGARRFRLTIP